MNFQKTENFSGIKVNCSFRRGFAYLLIRFTRHFFMQHNLCCTSVFEWESWQANWKNFRSIQVGRKMHFDNLIIAEMFDFSKNSIDHFLLEIFAIFFCRIQPMNPNSCHFRVGSTRFKSLVSKIQWTARVWELRLFWVNVLEHSIRIFINLNFRNPWIFRQFSKILLAHYLLSS